MDCQHDVVVGSILGAVIHDVGVNTLAVVDGGNPYLASAVLSSFLAVSPSVGRIFRPEEVEELRDFDPHLIFLTGDENRLLSILDVLAHVESDILLDERLVGLSVHRAMEGRDVFSYEVEGPYLVLVKPREGVEVFRYRLPADVAWR